MDKLGHDYDFRSLAEVVLDPDDVVEAKRTPAAKPTGERPSPTYSVGSLMDGRSAYSAVFDPV